MIELQFNYLGEPGLIWSHEGRWFLDWGTFGNMPVDAVTGQVGQEARETIKDWLEENYG